MAKFLKKLDRTIEATQWCKNGDHPEDDVMGVKPEREGKVVGYYRNPHVKGSKICLKCGYKMHMHGWIGSPKYTVCPGDWIITGEFGDHSACDNRLFKELYEPMEEEPKKVRIKYTKTLDVKTTHYGNPECPMRIAQGPTGEWYCVDCELFILHKTVESYVDE